MRLTSENKVKNNHNNKKKDENEMKVICIFTMKQVLETTFSA